LFFIHNKTIENYYLNPTFAILLNKDLTKKILLVTFKNPHSLEKITYNHVLAEINPEKPVN